MKGKKRRGFDAFDEVPLCRSAESVTFRRALRPSVPVTVPLDFSLPSRFSAVRSVGAVHALEQNLS